tara:strand:- start:101 stop:937 length:837 start_codon:yes stop_codon:yes gene_type:complete
MSKEEQNNTVVEEEVKPSTETNNENDAVGDEEELSPWYYFFSQGCGWCKKATPVVEELNSEGKHPEILLLDTAEPDNAKLRDELFAEYKTQCGTPFFINADTGESVCGFREKDVLEKWLSGEHIPAPPRVNGQFPKVPFQGSDVSENSKWKKSYEKWLSDNEHMPKDWQDKQKTADEIISGPRPKSDPPQLPPLNNATEDQIDKWGEELKVWQKENSHLPNLQDPNMLIKSFKQRINGGNPNQAAGGAVDNTKLNSMDARVQALEVKIDRIISHFGIK